MKKIVCSTCKKSEARVLVDIDRNINLCFICFHDYLERNKKIEYCKYCQRGIEIND